MLVAVLVRLFQAQASKNYCPVKFEKIRNYVILISNGFINGGWIWRMQNIVFV